jgi:serine/threonine protein kinase
MSKKCPKCGVTNSEDAKYCKDCGYLLEATEEVTPSKKVSPDSTPSSLPYLGPRFKVLELIGVGGMGKVYKVKDTELDEIIAVKLLLEDLSSDEKMVDYFKREIRLARKVKHRNICRVHDLQESEGKKFISMEFVDGITLKNLIIKHGSIPLEDGLKILKQVCEGLKACHDAGIVHRDISSKNIMIDKSGTAMIMDFGISRTSAITGSGTASSIVGTPQYMSPEQIEGKKVDSRSDIYSLGIVMYEMFTGSLPFTGTTPIAVAMRHLKEKPVNPSRLNRTLPKRVSEIILKCLEKDRTRRYQNIEELLKDLSEVEEMVSTEFLPPPKRRLSINYFAFPIAILVLIGLWFLLKPHGEVKKPSPEPKKEEINIPSKETFQKFEPKPSVLAPPIETPKKEITQKPEEKEKVSKLEKQKPSEKNIQTQKIVTKEEKPNPPEKKKEETKEEMLIRMGNGIFSPIIPFDNTFVIIDGEYYGNSPISSIELKEGTHKIELRNFELNAYLEDEIEIIAGKTIKKNFSFPQKGVIQVSAIPWAEIFIEGKSFGQTPIDRIELPVGYYEIIFRHPSFPEKKIRVAVKGDTVQKLETIDMRR